MRSGRFNRLIGSRHVGDSISLSVTLRSVRDLAVPLGAFANVYCTFTAPPLAGAGAGRRTRTTAGALPPQGAAAAEASSASYVFSVDASELFEWLEQQPSTSSCGTATST